jgi:hypothetical protein
MSDDELARLNEAHARGLESIKCRQGTSRGGRDRRASSRMTTVLLVDEAEQQLRDVTALEARRMSAFGFIGQ